MPPLNLPIRVMGRPLKPVSLSFTAAMLLIVYLNLSSTGIVGETSGRHFIALSAAAAAGLSIWGWVRHNQRAAEWGLLMVAFVWASRFWAGGLSVGFELGNEEVWLSLCWSLLASGAFWLERINPAEREQ